MSEDGSIINETGHHRPTTKPACYQNNDLTERTRL
jgi:hypothetical protein